MKLQLKFFLIPICAYLIIGIFIGFKKNKMLRLPDIIKHCSLKFSRIVVEMETLKPAVGHFLESLPLKSSKMQGFGKDQITKT